MPAGGEFWRPRLRFSLSHSSDLQLSHLPDSRFYTEKKLLFLLSSRFSTQRRISRWKKDDVGWVGRRAGGIFASNSLEKNNVNCPINCLLSDNRVGILA